MIDTGGRQLGTKESELPQGSGHIPTGILWPSPINDVSENLISETLADTAAEVNQTLPNLDTLSRASSSESAQHAEATTSEDFILPSTCTSTRRDEAFVLYDGKADIGVRFIAFSTTRNMKTMAKYPDWIYF
ncbi:hypothetical protein ACHWQZ_G016492 [Mnemiopsis leidyi]